MKLFLSLLITLSTVASWAQVQSGSLISASKFNNSAFQVGDIKTSLQTEAQFQATHGDCWALLDGRNIAGKDLATLMGKTTLPDGRGMFLRGKQHSRNDGKGNPDGDLALGQIQDRRSNNLYQLQYDPYQANTSVISVPEDGSWSTFLTLASSGNNAARPFRARNRGGESRPDNLTVNYFVKIHGECN